MKAAAAARSILHVFLHHMEMNLSLTSLINNASTFDHLDDVAANDDNKTHLHSLTRRTLQEKGCVNTSHYVTLD